MVKSILTLLFTFILVTCYSQSTRSKKLNSLDSLLNGSIMRLITPGILDSMLIDNMYKISGTNIKEGKSAASSATIDDKSATVNLSFKPFKAMFFVQPTIAGTSSNGFVDVFSSGKYNKVFSGGLNFQRFLYSKIKVADEKTYDTLRTRLHNTLRIVRRKYIHLVEDRINPWTADIDSLKRLYKDNEHLFTILRSNLLLSESQVSAGGAADKFMLFYEYASKLVKAGVLDEEDLKLDPALIYFKLEGLDETDVANIFWDKMLQITDSLQYHIKATKVIKWFSGGILYNNQPQPILDTSHPGKPSTFYNEFITGKLAYNWLSIRPSGSGLYWSPNFSFSNTRNFKDDDKKTANFISQVPIGSASAERIDSSISYFEKVASRKFVWAFELPLLWYWKSSKLGLDIAIHAGGNDPKGDNVGGRIGLYIPVGTKDESLLSVEPLLRIQNLFENSTQKFFKDNLAFGFNVSISVPAFFDTK